MTQPLTVGIVGMGAIGVTHARALREIPGVELAAYSGGSTRSGAQAGWASARRMPHADLIDHGPVDIVVLCSPTALHGQAAITVARSGRHVVVEKPMTLSVAEADELVALQSGSERPVITMVAQRRFEPIYARVRELLEDGALGDVRLAATHVPWYRDAAYFAAAPWRSRAEEGGGSLVNQGVHNLDLLTWLCGPVEAVTAQSATLALPLDTEDTVVATARFASGALGLISTSTATPPGFPATLRVHTSTGRFELGQGEVRAWDIPGVPEPRTGAGPAGGADDPGAIGIEGHVAYWRDVIGAIRDGRRPLVDAEQGAAATRLIAGIYAAAQQGRTIRPADLT